MKYKVVEETGSLRKGDVLEQDGNMWVLREETENSYREIVISKEIVDALYEQGSLLAEEECESCEDCCNALDKVRTFVDEKLEQYKQDYNNMMEAYENQDIPACVKVEAETVYYNMTKVLNAVKNLMNE